MTTEPGAEGLNWTSNKREYMTRLDFVTTCVHLQRTEQAMRKSGLRVKMERAMIACSTCVLTGIEFEDRLPFQREVVYKVIADRGRSYEDPRLAVLECTNCPSMIYVIHPLDADSSTPVFRVT